MNGRLCENDNSSENKAERYKQSGTISRKFGTYLVRSQKNAFDAELMTQGLDKVRAKINELRNKQTSATEDDILTTLDSVYEFYMRGFSFAPMSVMDSDATKFLIANDNQLRAPFVSIGGLGEAAAYDLANAAKSGKSFLSIEELSEACPKVSFA